MKLPCFLVTRLNALLWDYVLVNNQLLVDSLIKKLLLKLLYVRYAIL